jgi:hypothetical protein
MYALFERGPVTLQLKTTPKKLKQNFSTYNFRDLLLQFFPTKILETFLFPHPPPNATCPACSILLGQVTEIMLGNITVSFKAQSLVP